MCQKNDEIRIGFIGCGSIAYKHLQVLKNIDGVKITGVFDPDKGNSERFSKDAGNVRIYSSEEEIIKSGNIDGVVICSPHKYHFPQIKLALENNLHILVEKPAVINSEELSEVKRLLEEKKKVFVVGYQRHYLGTFLGAREEIKNGRIGKIIFVCGYLAQGWIELIKRTKRTWRFDPEISGGGQLMDSGSHFLAMLFFLTDLTPSDVYSFIDYRGMKVDINTSFIVKFKEGAIGNFGILGIDPGFREALLIWGEKGVIKVSSAGEDFYIHINGEKSPSPIRKISPSVKTPAEDFIECIRKNKKPNTDFSVIEKVVRLTEMVYKSVK